MPRIIRKTRLFPLALLAILAIVTFRVSAEQQTGTWKIAAASDTSGQPSAPDAVTPNAVRRENGGLVSRGAAATFLPDGGILIAGGRSLESASTRVVRFDVNIGATLLAPLNFGRADHTATTLRDGRVLVTGGTAADGATLSSAEIFDGNEWVVVPMSEARAHHTATLLKDGRVLVAGGDRSPGRIGGAVRAVPSSTVEIFDPATNMFSLAGVMGASRARHAAALLPDGTMLVAGGQSRNRVTGATEVLSSTEIIDLAAGSRRDGPSMDIARENFTATSLVNGDILIAGGNDGTNDTASAERYVSADGRFVRVGWLQQTRQGHVALRLPNNNGVLIAGGTTSGEALLSSEMFMPASGMFVPTGNTLTSHEDAVISRTAVAGTAVIMGGSDGSSETYSFATVTTDKLDYAPGEPVTITGTGWVPGELVSLELREDPFIDAHALTPVTADVDGNIYSREFAPDQDDLNVTFYLTARGSVSEAQTVFSDSQPQAVTLTPSTVTVAPGNDAVYTVNVQVGGNAGDCTITLTVPTSLPTGTSAAFSGGLNPFTTTASYTRTLTISTTSSTPPASYPFTVRATRGSNCQGNGVIDGAGTLVVSGPLATSLALGAPSPGFVTYGSTGPVTFSATLTRTTGGNPVAGAVVDFAVDSTSVGTAVTNVAGVANLSTYNPSALNAGGRTVQASFSAQTISSVQYAASTSGTQTLTVNKADQTITFGALATKTYGDADFLVSATGGASGNAVTFTASGDCTVSTATVHIVAAGSCTITAHQTGNSNYNAATDVPQSFTINKKSVTAVIAVNDKVYDANNTATLKDPGGRMLNVVLPVDEATLDFTIATLTFDNAHAGPNKTVTATGLVLTGSSEHNYQLSSTTATTTASISKADAHCTVTGYSVTYDATAHTATGSCLGVEGETLAGLNLTGTSHTDAGTYNGDGWSFTDVTGNYKDTNGSVNDAIAKADASVVVNSFSGTYDGHAHGATLGHATGVNSVDLSAGITLGASFTNVPGGTAHWTFAGGTNYNDKSGDANIAISKANASCSVTGYSVTYDGNAHTATGSCAGVQSESLSGLDLSGTTHTNAGTYGSDPWTFTDGTGNYNNTNGTVSDAISKADASVVVNGFSGPYDGAAHGATLDHATGVGGANLSAGINLGASFTDVPGGSAHWTFSFANYNDQSGDAAITISKADASVLVNGYSGTFDNAAHGATLDHATGVGGANLSAGINLGDSFTNVPGGSAHWTFSGGTNYNDQSGDVAITISKADASVLVNGYSGTFDNAAHGATLDHATGVGGANLSAGINLGDSFTNVPGGSAHWTFSGGTNYNDQSGDVAITISKADASVLVNGYSGTFDNAAHGATLDHATGVGGANLSAGIALGDSFTNVPGGTAHWTFSVANYNDQSGDVAVTIGKANATISVTPYSVTYDANPHTATGTAKGAQNESLAGLVLTGTTHTAAGSYPIDGWTFTDVTGNYNDASSTVSDSIAKADASVVVNGYSGIYDGNSHGATLGHATGVGGANLSAGVGLGATFTNVPGGTAHWTFSFANYNDQSGDVSIAITKANPSVDVTNYSVLYDAHPHTANGHVTGVKGESLSGLDLNGTTHTPANVYHDTWTFTDSTGNYQNAAGPLTDIITYNVCVLYDQVKPNKKGSTIPLKMSLCDASGNNVSSESIVVQAVDIVKVSGSVPPFDAEDSGNANPDLNFRYAGGFYIFNLSTKNPQFSQGEWKLRFTVNGIPNGYVLTFFIK